MQKKIRLTTALAIILVVAIFTYIAASVLERDKYELLLETEYSEKYSETASNSEIVTHALSILNEAKTIVEKRYLFELDEDAIREAVGTALYEVAVENKFTDSEEAKDYILNAYFNAIEDKYTMYHSKSAMQSMKEEDEGVLYGIGIYVYLDIDDGAIVVNRVMANSPAEKAGIAHGDRIVKVGDIVTTVDNYNDCIKAVKGELGTTVTLTIKRDGTELVVNAERGKVDVQSVFLEYIGDYAYITIEEFSGLVATDFEKYVKEAEEKNVKGYIFDVRDNPGGDLSIITDVLDVLVPEGPIARVCDADGNAVYQTESGADEINKPMVVICNGSTASAGELFTSTLRDYGKAKIVGSTTFGKGIMQNIITLSDGSGIRVTTYYYNPPYGDNYHLVGITPDVEVEEDEYITKHKYDRGSDIDNVLTAAIAELDKLVENNK